MNKIKLLEFIKNEDWKIKEKYKGSLNILPGALELIISSMFEAKTSPMVEPILLVMDSKKNIINGYQSIIGFILLLKNISPLNHDWKNLSKIISKKIDSPSINQILFDDKGLSKELITTMESQNKITQSNFDNLFANPGIKILEGILDKFYINVVNLDDKCDLFTTKSTMLILQEQPTIANSFANSVFAAIESDLMQKESSKIISYYEKNIIDPYSRHLMGNYMFDQLDNMIHHCQIVDDLSALRAGPIKANYVSWRGYVFARSASWILMNNGGRKFSTFNEYKKFVDMFKSRCALLSEMTTGFKNTNITDFHKLLIIKLISNNLPAEFIIRVISDDCSFTKDKLVISLSKKSEEMLSNMYKLVLRLSLLPMLQNPQEKGRLIMEIISNIQKPHDFKDILNSAENTLASLINHKDNDQKVVDEIIQKTLKAKTLDLLENPLMSSPMLISAIAEIFAYIEYIKYDHSVEEYSNPTPIYISKMIAPSGTNKNSFLFLGDILFLPQNISNEVMQSMQARKMPDWQQVYFNACKTYKYLMEDKILMNVISSRTFSSDDLNNRTQHYKKLIEYALAYN